MMSILCPFPLMNDFLESFYTLIPPKIGRDSCTFPYDAAHKIFWQWEGSNIGRILGGDDKKT